MHIKYTTKVYPPHPMGGFLNRGWTTSKAEHIDYCCQELEAITDWDGDLRILLPGYEGGTSLSDPIHFCPFCGQQITSEETRRVNMKRVETTQKVVEYIEVDSNDQA